MIIKLKKFGEVLVSRPAGKESWLAYQPILKDIPKSENIIVDFTDVAVLTPSWADEFLTPLRQRFGNNVKLKSIDNPSIKATLKALS